MIKKQQLITSILALTIGVLGYLLYRKHIAFDTLESEIIKEIKSSGNSDQLIELRKADSLSWTLYNQIDTTLNIIIKQIESGSVNINSMDYSGFCMLVSYDCGKAVLGNLHLITKRDDIEFNNELVINNSVDLEDYIQKLSVTELLFELRNIQNQLIAKRKQNVP